MNTFLLAVATLTLNSISQNPTTRTVTVDYTLTGENAVVTLGSVLTNGAPMAASDLSVVTGDANRLLAPGAHSLKWQPPVESGFGPFDMASTEIALKAWATNAPPDYMVINLSQPTCGVRYYASAEAIPGGVTDRRYKTDCLVMRRIPAAGVTWRMGSPTGEAGRAGSLAEATHYVKLTEDFYLAVYETTCRQYYWLYGSSASTSPNNIDMRPYGAYDWDIPVSVLSYANVRGNQHGADCALTGDALKEPFKIWPQSGHELTPNGTKCSVCNKSSNCILAKVRERWPDFLFDLPTEAQWEFACRGGAQDYEVRPGSPSDLDEIAWYVANSSNQTAQVVTAVPHPVGLKKPNNYGLYDMLGNLAEWTLDGYGAFPNSDGIVENPQGAELPWKRTDTVSRRVLRGGCFMTTAGYVRSAGRVALNLFYTSCNAYTPSSASAVSPNACGLRLWLPCHAVK